LHAHEDSGDFILVIKGRLTIQLRNRDVELAARWTRAMPADR
jgi:hypothetical protein